MCNILYNEVLRLVSEETEISEKLITSKSRIADVVDARQMVVWFSFKIGMRPKTIADKLNMSRQAVCQKIQSIAEKRKIKSFEFVFNRVSEKLKKSCNSG